MDVKTYTSTDHDFHGRFIDLRIKGVKIRRMRDPKIVAAINAAMRISANETMRFWREDLAKNSLRNPRRRSLYKIYVGNIRYLVEPGSQWGIKKIVFKVGEKGTVEAWLTRSLEFGGSGPDMAKSHTAGGTRSTIVPFSIGSGRFTDSSGQKVTKYSEGTHHVRSPQGIIQAHKPIARLMRGMSKGDVLTTKDFPQIANYYFYNQEGQQSIYPMYERLTKTVSITETKDTSGASHRSGGTKIFRTIVPGAKGWKHPGWKGLRLGDQAKEFFLQRASAYVQSIFPTK